MKLFSISAFLILFWNLQLTGAFQPQLQLVAITSSDPLTGTSRTICSTRDDITRLYQSASSEGEDEGNDTTSAKVRFSGFELGKQSSSSSTDATTSNPLDSALSLITSDIASIALGLIGICLLLIERLTLPDAASMGKDQYQYAERLGEETRSNLIAVLACGSVLLNGISRLDVTSALAEAVELEGVLLSQPKSFFSDDNPFRTQVETLEWGMESLLQASPAKSVVLLQTTTTGGWEVISMLGAMPIEATRERPEVPHNTPILDRFLKQDNSGELQTYLPTLQALPGKKEFTYIPANTQEVLILSVPTTLTTTTTTLLLGSNRAKSFTPRDIAWCQTLTSRLGAVVSPAAAQ